MQTFEQLVRATECAKNQNDVVINFEEDIVFCHPVEISECNNLEITSENGCVLTGGIVNPKWTSEGEYLICIADCHPRMLIINEKLVKKNIFPC